MYSRHALEPSCMCQRPPPTMEVFYRFLLLSLPPALPMVPGNQEHGKFPFTALDIAVGGAYRKTLVHCYHWLLLSPGKPPHWRLTLEDQCPLLASSESCSLPVQVAAAHSAVLLKGSALRFGIHSSFLKSPNNQEAMLSVMFGSSKFRYHSLGELLKNYEPK